MRRRALALALALGVVAGPDARAQEAQPATLVADRVEIDAEGRLVASGAVEALQGETRLTASRIVYDAETGALRIDGPITLREGEDVVVLADAGALSGDLREGLLRSARLVLDRQLQFAAAEINRVGGRYTQLSKVVASSCEVCAAAPVPLWQIRASRIVHDQLERQIYFEDPRFEVMGVPVLYLPYLRLPDPTLERATGFLAPRFTRSDRLGFGIKVPYFMALDRSRDLLLTPFVSPETLTLEGRYRQAFRSGRLRFDGAVSRDTLREGETRGYLFGAGSFRLPQDYRLRFDVELASDEDYLDDYDYSDKERLDSAIALLRGGRDRFFGAEAIYFEVPGADFEEELRPSILGDVLFLRRFTPPGIGGTGSLRVLGHGHQRPSGDDIVGRDVARLEAELGWRRDAVGPAGLLFGAEARLLAQYDRFDDDSLNDAAESRLIPSAAAELRWPLARQGGAGARHVIEPVAQLVWTSEEALTHRPSEESRQVALDEGNLFAFSRFPAGDRVEAGLRANLGLSYTRYDPSGWALGLTVGRVLRQEDLGQFDGYDAFDGTRTDWLLAANLDADRVRVTGRALFDDALEADRFETRFGYRGDRLALAGTYAWLAPEPEAEREETINQWRVDSTLQVNERWTASADIAYDLERDRAATTTLGVEYRANCVTVDVGLRRRFTEEDQSDPNTTFSFQIALAGFGADGDRPRPRRRACLR